MRYNYKFEIEKMCEIGSAFRVTIEKFEFVCF